MKSILLIVACIAILILVTKKCLKQNQQSALTSVRQNKFKSFTSMFPEEVKIISGFSY